MKAFFIGAGASRGTFQSSGTCVPVAVEFGKVLQIINPQWTATYPALASVISHLRLCPDDWGLERVWSCMDYYAKLQEAIPAQQAWSDGSPQMKKALLQVYGKRCDDMAEQLRLTDDYTLGRLLKNELTQGDILISFNYDTIIERLARKFGHAIQSVDATNKTKGITLAKPHGSTSWTLDRSVCPNRVSASRNGDVLLDSLSHADVDHNREPLLLGAVPIKSELIREVQVVCMASEVFDAISRQWKAVIEAIRDADVVIVVGYSFPREDQYGRFLMQEGMRLRDNNRKLTVEFFELKDKASDRAKEILDAFDVHVEKLIYRGEVVPPM